MYSKRFYHKNVGVSLQKIYAFNRKFIEDSIKSFLICFVIKIIEFQKELKIFVYRSRSSLNIWSKKYSYFRIYEVTHDRQANNDKELTIKVGELLEVLDDKRNWWKLRSFYGNVGHAPVTILRPFETSSINTTNSNVHNNHSSYQDQDKVGYF